MHIKTSAVMQKYSKKEVQKNTKESLRLNTPESLQGDLQKYLLVQNLQKETYKEIEKCMYFFLVKNRVTKTHGDIKKHSFL